MENGMIELHARLARAERLARTAMGTSVAVMIGAGVLLTAKPASTMQEGSVVTLCTE